MVNSENQQKILHKASGTTFALTFGAFRDLVPFVHFKKREKD